MFCPHCGNQMNDSATFCNVCGAKMDAVKTAAVQQPAQQPVQQYAAPVQRPAQSYDPMQQTIPMGQYAANARQAAPAAKKKGAKTALVVILVILIVAALAAGAVLFLPELLGGAVKTTDHLAVFGGYAIYNGQLVENVESCRNDIRYVSLAGNCYIVRGEEFYAIKDGIAYEFEDAGDPNGFCFSVAASGNGVAYYTTSGGVFLMDTNTGDITEIEEEGKFGFVISPDGKTVLYSDGKEAYLYTDGESERVMKSDNDHGRLSVVAVADGGEYMYLSDLEESQTFYCLDKDGKEIYKRKNTSLSIATNYDNTQMLLGDDEDYSLHIIYDVKNDEETKIKGSDFTREDVRPVAAQCYSYRYHHDYASVNPYIAKVANYNVDDMRTCYYTAYMRGYGGGIGVLDGKKVDSVFGEEDAIKLLSDGRIVAIDWDEGSRENGDLILYKDGEEEEIDSDVAGFGVSLDEKTIYYFTEDDELKMYRNGKSEVIDDDDVCVNNHLDGMTEVGVGVPTIVGNDIILYGKNDGEWYIYKDGEVDEFDDRYQYPRDTFAGYSTWGCVLETKWMNSYRSSVLFVTAPYLPYADEEDLFVMDAEGVIVELDID